MSRAQQRVRRDGREMRAADRVCGLGGRVGEPGLEGDFRLRESVVPRVPCTARDVPVRSVENLVAGARCVNARRAWGGVVEGRGALIGSRVIQEPGARVGGLTRETVEGEHGSVPMRWRGNGRASRWLCAVALVACAWGATGCEPTAKEKLVEARTALVAGDADKAEKALDEALAKDASLIEAERMKWRVFLLRKQYDKAEQALKDFSEKQGLGKDGLTGDKKSLKKLVESDYNELYCLWAEGVGSDSPTKYREVLEAGLARDPKDPELNRMLVAHLQGAAGAALKKGDKVAAAQAYEALLGLRTMPATRKDARTQAVNLRKEIFMDASRTRFDGEVKPKLGDLYDSGSGTIHYVIASEVDRALNPRKPEDVTQAQAIAVTALGVEVQAHVRQIGGLGPEVELIKQPNGIKILEESFERGIYKVKGSVPVADVMEYAHSMRNRADRAAAKKGASQKKTSPDKGAMPAKDSSGAPDGKAVEPPADGPAPK